MLRICSFYWKFHIILNKSPLKVRLPNNGTLRDVWGLETTGIRDFIIRGFWQNQASDWLLVKY